MFWVDASQIEYVDDNNSAIAIARHASVQMEDAPGGGAQNLVSLWQTDTAGIKLTRYVKPGNGAALASLKYRTRSRIK